MTDFTFVDWHSDPNSAKLGVIEFKLLPFQVKRIYWISDFKPGTVRGNHAHKSLVQLFVLVSGTITLEIFKGLEKVEHHLDSSSQPILIDSGSWRVMKEASADAVLLVLASNEYDESDYIRSWEDYLNWWKRTHD